MEKLSLFLAAGMNVTFPAKHALSWPFSPPLSGAGEGTMQLSWLSGEAELWGLTW